MIGHIFKSTSLQKCCHHLRVPISSGVHKRSSSALLRTQILDDRLDYRMIEFSYIQSTILDNCIVPNHSGIASVFEPYYYSPRTKLTLSVKLTEAPCSRSATITYMWPLLAATISAVAPLYLAMVQIITLQSSYTYLVRYLTIALFPIIRALLPLLEPYHYRPRIKLTLSDIFSKASRSRSATVTCLWPFPAAYISAVAPLYKECGYQTTVQIITLQSSHTYRVQYKTIALFPIIRALLPLLEPYHYSPRTGSKARMIGNNAIVQYRTKYV